MGCKEIRNRVLEGVASGDDMTGHLAKCEDCSGFTTTLERFIKAKPDTSTYKIPRALDDSVTREAYAWIESSSPPVSPSGASLRERLRKWPFIFACAACVVIVAWLVFAVVSRGGRSGEFSSEGYQPGVSDVGGLTDDKGIDGELAGIGESLDHGGTLTTDMANQIENPDAEIEFMLLEYLESDESERDAVVGRLKVKLAELHQGNIERQRARLSELDKRLSILRATLDKKERDSDQIIDSEINRLIEIYRK